MPQETSWETGLPLHRVESTDLRTCLYRKQKQIPVALPASEHQLPDNRFLLHLRQSFPFLLLLDDGGPFYIRRGYREAVQIIEREGITHLFSSFRPWSDHLLARRLKKRFPQLVWIADFRDLHADPVRRDVWWPALQRWWARRIIRRADVVTTVSEGLADRLRKLHPRVEVLRNGLTELPSPFPSVVLNRYFSICYTGSLYPALQSADPLLRVLRQLLDEGRINPFHLELVYAGKDGDTWREWTRRHALSHHCRFLGVVPQTEALRLQRESQFNLLLSWSAPGYGGILTAKLYDYIAAGRPILALLSGPGDPELNTLVAATGAGKVYASDEPGTEEELRGFLLSCYETWRYTGALPWQSSPQKLQDYTWQAQVSRLINRLP